MIVLMTAAKLAQPGVRMLAEAGLELRLLTSDDPSAEMADLLRKEPVTALISRTLPVTADHIRSCPSLRIISRHGVGYNNVDLDAATARGIPVTIADGANGQSVAELAIALMLAIARNIPELDRTIRAGEWNRTLVGRQLSDKTLGLVAYGGIARAVGRMASAMGMQVAVFDPFVTERVDGIAFKNSLAELLDVADVLSLHTPLTNETRGMIGASELARLPKGAIIVNTARGGLIDELALVDAIRSGHLCGAGIDTFADEPLPADHPFLAEPRVVMTPHMGGSTDAALDGVAISAAQNVIDTLLGSGPNPRLVVNPAVLRTVSETSHA
jgi:D-3-phosphoglycerate dehydrogenase